MVSRALRLVEAGGSPASGPPASPSHPLMSSAPPIANSNTSYPDTFDVPEGGFGLFAPAKVNLGLRVVGKRPDGYHDLDTLFQEIDWCDRLEFYPADQWTLTILGADLDPGEANLVTRAARRLAQEAGCPCHARIVLQKEIPMGGGLGGGSSDAAVALIGLSRLWGLNWPSSQLELLAAELGSDCAFFIHGGLARGGGRGEILDLLPGNVQGELVLIIPPYGVSTAWAFNTGQFPLTGDVKSVILWFYSDLPAVSAFPQKVAANDLENIVLSRHSDLAEIKLKLTDLGAEAAMLSGSGSTIYGIFSDPARAVHAAHQFGSPYRVRICRTICRRRCVR
jgi:4-diphosphocytidyl-2-C-methyl-D-erythritol kinase